MDQTDIHKHSSKRRLRTLADIVSVSAGILSIGYFLVNWLLGVIGRPYFPSYALWILSALLVAYLLATWGKHPPIDSRIVITSAIPILVILAFHLFRNPPLYTVLEFWRPFVDAKECSIVTGSPQLWTGPHDPATGPIDLIRSSSSDRVIIHNGLRLLPGGLSVALTDTTYMVPRSSFSSFYEFRAAYELVQFLLPEVRSEILSSEGNVQLDENLILLGGPRANPIVSDILNELYVHYDVRFSFRFLLRARTGLEKDGPLIHVVDRNTAAGIGDALDQFHPILEYSPEQVGDAVPGRAGHDGAIIIKSFNPYAPDKTVLILAGFEEAGTLAAVEILRKPSKAMDTINSVHRGPGAVTEIVVATPVVHGNPSAPRVVSIRSVSAR